MIAQGCDGILKISFHGTYTKKIPMSFLNKPTHNKNDAFSLDIVYLPQFNL